MSKLTDSIDALFAEEAISSDAAQKLLDLTLKHYEAAESRMYKRFTTVIFLWLVAFGIGQGMLAEASLLSIKVNDLTTLLIAFPFVTATVYYGLIASLCAAGNCMYAIRRLIKHHWKKVYKNDLDILVMPQTFLSMEITTFRTVSGWPSKLHVAWIILMVGTIMLLPVACLAHMSYLTLSRTPVPLWLSLAVIFATVLIVVRAIALFIQTTTYSGWD